MDSDEQSAKPTEERSLRSKFNRRWVKITAGVVTAGVLLVLGVTAEAVTPSPGHKRPPPTPTSTSAPTPTPTHTSTPTPTSTPAPTGSGSAARVGIADPDLIGETAAVQASQLAAMKAIGITSIRLDANWDWVQYGGQTSFDWTGLDQVVKSARAAGMSVDLIVDGSPPWAAQGGTTGNPPASAAQYATWAADVAARYAPLGVGTFEIWNEENINWGPSANAAAYTADLIAAYAAIKKADPSAFVISGGLAPATTGSGMIAPVTFLQEMYADGAKGSFDAVGDHPYSNPALPNTYEAWSGWSQMAQTSPSIRSVMVSNGDTAKQVWITEVGAPSGGPDSVGQAAQATEMTQAIADAKTTSWIGAIYLYSWQDEGTSQSTDQDWYGLVTAAGAQKLDYAAVATALK